MSALPEGMPITLDADARWFGNLLVGGSPRRALRLTDEGRIAVEQLCSGGVNGPAARELGRRLVDAGIAHPQPGSADGDFDATVIVPVRDRLEALERCLAALGRETAVIVVDDGSLDPERIRSVCASHGASLVRRDRSGGPAAARNDALRSIGTELVAFCDSDCEPGPGWLGALAKHFADPLMGAVAPRVLPHPAGDGASWVKRYAAARSPLDMGSKAGPVEPGARIPYVPSAALIVRREALADGFDSTLRFGEDVDLIWRMHDAGWRIRYEPSVVVRHAEPERLGELLSRRFRYGASAGPLSQRHPGRLAHVRVPLPGRGSLRRATEVGVPPGRALAWSGRRAVQAAAGLSQAATSFAWPLVAAGLLRRSTRPAAVTLLAASALDSWRRSDTNLDPFRWMPTALVDDAAYGAGVWHGCLRERTLEPIRPQRGAQPVRRRGAPAAY